MSIVDRYDHCISGPCHNDGTCSLSEQVERGWECTCLSGWVGDTCDEGNVKMLRIFGISDQLTTLIEWHIIFEEKDGFIVNNNLKWRHVAE